MFDIGWPELLVVAIVLIVVVGPKDLPPMLRAFGRTTKKLRGMANEFRGQFDEALREAELDDVKKTFDEARKLNPMQGIRDAVNPLKDTARDIKSDLEKSVKTPSSEIEAPAKVAAPEPTMKLDDGPPAFKPDPAAEKPAAAADKPVAKPAEKAAKGKPSATTGAAASKASTVSKAQSAKPAKAPAKSPAKARTAASKPAAKTASKAQKTAAADKGKAPAKRAPRARKTDQGEGKA